MADPFKVQIKGLVRFSYIAATANRPRGTVDPAAISHMFAPDKIDLRFALFDYFTLPALRRQTDRGFATVILTSEGLPEPVLDRLLTAIEKFDNLSIVPLPPLPLPAAATRAFKRMPNDDSASHIATFRLDEGAALQDGAIATIRARALARLAQGDPDRPFALNFGKGYALNLAAAPGTPRLTEVCWREPQPNGLTMVAPAGEKLHVQTYWHSRLLQHVDFMSDLSAPMFLRADMRDVDLPGLALPEDRTATERILAKNFGLSLNDLENG